MSIGRAISRESAAARRRRTHLLAAAALVARAIKDPVRRTAGIERGGQRFLPEHRPLVAGSTATRANIERQRSCRGTAFMQRDRLSPAFGPRRGGNHDTDRRSHTCTHRAGRAALQNREARAKRAGQSTIPRCRRRSGPIPRVWRDRWRRSRGRAPRSPIRQDHSPSPGR